MNIKVGIIIGAALLMQLAGCAQVGYYVQAAQGQFALLAEARPIDDWLLDPQTAVPLKHKLKTVRAIRQFAARELALPDNRSYTAYADLKRPFVLWNVIAAPALSLQPKEWCFPVAGCVSYRGYYSKQQAQEYAAELRAEGYDVQVAGVPAYSTLGWFDDPVLSTFIRYPDGELARLIFHELAHQVAYASGDSTFNESFATAVEEAGVARWLALEGDDQIRAAYARFESRKQDFLHLLLKYRLQLQHIYAQPIGDAEKLQRKAATFAALKAEYQTLKTGWGGYTGYDRWFAEPLSNAHLAAVETYQELVPAFRTLLARADGFPAFYATVRQLAQETHQQRRQQLALLTQPMAPLAAAPTTADRR
ncbi:MAG TPA: aminopeptidase [Burkholderiaceae bacterium]|nr:aminopeptidase [Burkholderiaceae bacterium]